MAAPKQLEHTQEECDNALLLHKGKYATLIRDFPRVETFTLSQGWNDQKASAFVAAVQRVARENPVLTSHLEVRQGGAIYAVTGTYPPEQHSFVTVTDVSDDVHPADLQTQAERLDFMHQHVSPLIGKSEQNDYKTKCPIFEVHLFRFSQGYACSYVAISHSIVDARTYYQIIEQISDIMNGKELQKIRWGNPSLTTLELPPDHYSDQDIGRIGLLPMILGVIRATASGASTQRTEEIWILSKEKIAQRKKDLHDTSIAKYLSSHDVIFSTISQLVKSSDEFYMVMDARGRYPDFDENDGGNCLKQFGMPREASSNPNLVRKAVEKGYYYETNQVKGLATRRGRCCFTSSWMLAYKSIDGISTLCHSPSMAFVSGTKVDMAVIFPVDDESIGVCHKFYDIHDEEASRILEQLSV